MKTLMYIGRNKSTLSGFIREANMENCIYILLRNVLCIMCVIG